MMTHDDLCQRAIRWLYGSLRCTPVLHGIASCSEIPDAIGWTSRGSVVVECKTSKNDFYADKKKRIARAWDSERPTVLPRMGDYRYFLCEPYVLSPEQVTVNFPDHGLAWVTGKNIRIKRAAPERNGVDHESEIRYLRFAIIHLQSNHPNLDLAGSCQHHLTKLRRDSRHARKNEAE